MLSDQVTQSSFVLYHLKNYDFQWQSFTDLARVKIGITSNYNYGAEFMAVISANTMDVELATKYEFNFKKLLVGQIDVFPNDPIVGLAQIKNALSPTEVSQITYNTKEFGVSTLHLIISNNNKRK